MPTTRSGRRYGDTEEDPSFPSLVREESNFNDRDDKKERSPHRLVSAGEVPVYLQEPFVFNGYRPESNSYSACGHSMFYIHNQTGEVLTHVIALVAYIYFAYNTFELLQADQRATSSDYVIFSVYYVGVWICFGSSALFHLLSNHSHSVHDLMYRMDRCGIVAPFFGSMLLLASYTFQCHSTFRIMHLSATFVTCFAVLYTTILGDDSSHSVSRSLRIYISFAMFGVGLLCVAHMLVILGDDAGFMGKRFILTYFLYGIGVVFYVSRFPERWAPGKFDFFLKSHQIWHSFVFLGAANFYYLVTETYLWAKATTCPIDS